VALRLFTSESVTEGHPDKVADQISDSVLDAILTDDPAGRVACETMVTTGQVMVTGEITTSTYVDIARCVRDTLVGIGYDSPDAGFDGNTCGVSVSIDPQSPDIAQGVDAAYEGREQGLESDPYGLQGAGDQGMMFGYATDETPSLMPLPIDLAHRMARRLAEVRHTGQIPYLRPDGKTQITVGYEHGVAKAVTAVVLSTQHREDVDLPNMLRPEIEEQVIRPLLPGNVDLSDVRIFINPTGRFEVGGPVADAGLTGRKIIVDTYGGMARHGGGAFSGKDPSKVDRSAAYATRWVAKHIVAAGLARKAELQVAYAIGVASPVSLNVETFGTETVDPDRILEGVREVFDLRPAAIIDALQLRRPGYRTTAAYGHFGRDGERFTWERLDRVEALRAAVGA
jgi:S-adenosylmethionine synthetase